MLLFNGLEIFLWKKICGWITCINSNKYSFPFLDIVNWITFFRDHFSATFCQCWCFLLFTIYLNFSNSPHLTIQGEYVGSTNSTLHAFKVSALGSRVTFTDCFILYLFVVAVYWRQLWRWQTSGKMWTTVTMFSAPTSSLWVGIK